MKFFGGKYMNLGIENKEIEKYFYILSKEIPDFLIEYANVKEMQRLKGISMVSACEHTKLIPYNFFLPIITPSFVGLYIIIRIGWHATIFVYKVSTLFDI